MPKSLCGPTDSLSSFVMNAVSRNLVGKLTLKRQVELLQGCEFSVYIIMLFDLKKTFCFSFTSQTDLTFTVCLHYTYSNMDEEVQEQLPVTVGKPLVSKLNLHESRMSTSGPAYSCSSFDSAECSSLASDTWTSFGQTSTEFSHADSLTLSRSANMPEETDSPGVFNSPQPLTASKSLPHGHTGEINYKFSDMYNFHSF